MLNAKYIKIGGEQRKILFTREALLKLERMLPGGISLYSVVAGGILPMAALIPAVAFGLEAGGLRPLDMELVSKWVSKIEREEGPFNLLNSVMEAILASGAFGPIKVLHDEIEATVEEMDVSDKVKN
jgi:hypothetical protein|nr:MAG TPA: tail assembly chaperone protein [Caudoviricetes sp.]DAJ57292.1 MAG TPA: tail assembly chaperone protein [Caudoviricetes sp.]